MKLYYHHVGLPGASRDFPKTVFGSIPISVVRDHVDDSNPHKAEMVRVLRGNFPTGEFNCWGVPSGASNVINNLQAGDTVLLVESVGAEGRVPALCGIVGFWKDKLVNLSKALWGSDQFPFIFFFRTRRISLTWKEFSEHLGYSPNFNPRGQFYSVADSKLVPFGGAERYTEFIITHYAEEAAPADVITAEDIRKETGAADPKYVKEVGQEASLIKQQTLDKTPRLKEGSVKKRKEVVEHPRSAAFRVSVKKLYKFRCAVCGVGLLAPDGQPEVESAHIYPKRLAGSDDFRNGLCLCRRHHWAFDAGWFSIADDYTVIVRGDLPMGEEYEFIRSYAGREIIIPTQEAFAPHPLFLRAHRELKGFEDRQELLEDLEDLAVIAERRDEPTVSHDEVLAELKRDGIV